MNGKAKGSSYERSLCKQLSLWWSNNTSDCLYWRTSNSGGRATTRAKKGLTLKAHAGDIAAIDPIGQPFLDFCVIEAKKGYNSATIHDILDTEKQTTYHKWIDQAERSQEQAGSRYWLLIHKRDRREAVCCFPDDMFDELLNYIGCWPPYTLTRMECPDVILMRLDAFLQWVTPQTIHLILKEQHRAN